MKKSKIEKRMKKLGQILAHKMSKTHMLKLKKLRREVEKAEGIPKSWRKKKISFYKFLLRKEEASKGIKRKKYARN